MTPTPTSQPTPSNPLAIEWHLDVKQNNTFELHYKITNPTKSRYYVCDKLISSGSLPTESYRAFEGLTVQNGGPDTTLLILGTTPPATPAYRILPDTYVPLEPGASIEGTRTARWPFMPFNPHNAGILPLKPATQVAFMVFTFEGEPPTWREWPGEDGNPIRAPEGQTLAPMRTAPIPIPKP